MPLNSAGNEIEFDRLQREATNDRRLYDMVLKRLKDIELSGLLRTSNVRILDRARPALMPFSPNLPRNVLVALMAGLVLGVGFVLVLEQLDNTVKGQDDIEVGLQLPLLGIFPLALATTSQNQRGSAGLPRAYIGCRRVLPFHPHQLVVRDPRPDPSRRCSSRPAVPKRGSPQWSSASVWPWLRMATGCLLVDTDMRRPRLHRAFGVHNDVGVSSLVVNQGTLENAIKSTEVPGMYLLPCGPLPPNPAELLHTHAFNALIEDLRARFDTIILDSPPTNMVADSAVLSAKADGVVVVLKSEKTRRELARRCVRTLRDVNAKLMGAVLNRVDLQSGGYGGYYSSYLRDGYGSGENTNSAARSA